MRPGDRVSTPSLLMVIRPENLRHWGGLMGGRLFSAWIRDLFGTSLLPVSCRGPVSNWACAAWLSLQLAAQASGGHSIYRQI